MGIYGAPAMGSARRNVEVDHAIAIDALWSVPNPNI